MMASEAVPQSAERAEYERINAVELIKALDDYALARGVNLARDSQEGSFALASESPMPVIDGKTEDELRSAGYEDMRRSYDLLEDISAKPEGMGKPGCTVCIPLAILNKEDTSGVLDVLDHVRESQVKWGRDVTVIIWANAGYKKDENEAKLAQKAGTAYQALRTELEPKTGDGLRIMTALEVLPKEKPDKEIMTVNEAAMNRIRSHYEDAVSILVAKEGYGFDYPVIWLDADIKSMSIDTLEDLSKAVRHFDGLIPHADMQFTTEWVGDKGLAAADDATKAVAINEIQRRQLRRMGGRLQDGEYVEECGLAHAAGVGLRAGGIDTSILSHTNESASLKKRILLRSFQAGVGEGAVPQRLMELARGNTEDYDVPLTMVVGSARMYVSARGLRRAVQRVGVRALQADYRDEYLLYNDAGSEPVSSQPISSDEVNDLLDYNRGLYDISNDPDTDPKTRRRLQASRRRLGRVVNRLFVNSPQSE